VARAVSIVPGSGAISSAARHWWLATVVRRRVAVYGASEVFPPLVDRRMFIRLRLFCQVLADLKSVHSFFLLYCSVFSLETFNLPFSLFDSPSIFRSLSFKLGPLA